MLSESVGALDQARTGRATGIMAASSAHPEAPGLAFSDDTYKVPTSESVASLQRPDAEHSARRPRDAGEGAVIPCCGARAPLALTPLLRARAQYAGHAGYERDPESLEETPLMPHMTATESQLRCAS